MPLRTERIQILDDMRGFVEGNEPVDCRLSDRTYAFVRRTLVRFRYYG